jgi:Glycosyltransferase family 87
MKFPKLNIQFLILAVSAAIFLIVGSQRAFRYSYDFVPVYTGARCLIGGCNPYDTSQLQSQFFLAGGRASELPSWEIDVPVYPPSTFLVLSPLALLSYPVARFLWFLLNGCLFVVSAVLIFSVCPRSTRWFSTILISFVLVTSGILLVLGQPGALAISLVMISVSLFLRARLRLLSAFLLMLSLTVKPQIGGLIALYFLVQKATWRYAAWALAGALALLLGASLILGLHPRSSGWRSTLRANLSATLSPGGSADPRPANQEAIGDTNLQALTSIFLADAPNFNLAAYITFLGLLGWWVFALKRVNETPEKCFVALAALSILSLMPVYHRFYDTRLLLMTIPAAAIVFEKRRYLGTLIAILTAFAVVSVQYRVQLFLIHHAAWQSVQRSKLLFILLLRQQNLELLLLFGLYLIAIQGRDFSDISRKVVANRRASTP